MSIIYVTMLDRLSFCFQWPAPIVRIREFSRVVSNSHWLIHHKRHKFIIIVHNLINACYYYYIFNAPFYANRMYYVCVMSLINPPPAISKWNIRNKMSLGFSKALFWFTPLTISVLYFNGLKITRRWTSSLTRFRPQIFWSILNYLIPNSIRCIIDMLILADFKFSGKLFLMFSKSYAGFCLFFVCSNNNTKQPPHKFCVLFKIVFSCGKYVQ